MIDAHDEHRTLKFVRLGAALLCAVILPGCGTPRGSSLARSYQADVDSMKKLTCDLDTPKHLLKEDAPKRGDEFDVHSYFTVLKHVAMEDAYVLDYVYSYDPMGGEPVLYARKKNEAPFDTESALKDAVREGASLDKVEKIWAEYRKIADANKDGNKEATSRAWDDAYAKYDSIPNHDYWNWYLKHVRIDGTEAGFLEYVALHLLGGQFYLNWHSNCDDTVIASTQAAVARVCKDPVLVRPEAFAEVYEKAKEIDVEPKVVLKDKEATVAIVTFTKWGGFSRRKFVIKRTFPHSIKELEEEYLVPYECNFVY